MLPPPTPSMAAKPAPSPRKSVFQPNHSDCNTTNHLKWAYSFLGIGYDHKVPARYHGIWLYTRPPSNLPLNKLNCVPPGPLPQPTVDEILPNNNGLPRGRWVGMFLKPGYSIMFNQLQAKQYADINRKQESIKKQQDDDTCSIDSTTTTTTYNDNAGNSNSAPPRPHAKGIAEHPTPPKWPFDEGALRVIKYETQAARVQLFALVGLKDGFCDAYIVSANDVFFFPCVRDAGDTLKSVEKRRETWMKTLVEMTAVEESTRTFEANPLSKPPAETVGEKTGEGGEAGRSNSTVLRPFDLHQVFYVEQHAKADLREIVKQWPELDNAEPESEKYNAKDLVMLHWGIWQAKLRVEPHLMRAYIVHGIAEHRRKSTVDAGYLENVEALGITAKAAYNYVKRCFGGSASA